MATPLRKTMLVLALVLCSGAALAYSWPVFAGEGDFNAAGDASGNEPPPQITASSQSAVVALRVGLSPAAMAAAALNANAVTTSILALKQQLASSNNAIELADAAYGAARVAHDALERKVRAGTATQQEVASLQTAKSTLASATSARQATLDAAFSAATANLGDAQRATLSTIQSNRAWELPTEYLAEARTQEAWVALREALTNKQQAAAYSELMDAACSQTLASVEAQSATAAAKSNLAANLAAVTAAFNSAAAE